MPGYSRQRACGKEELGGGRRRAVALRLEVEQARVQRLERDQDLQPEEVGAAHGLARELEVAEAREELARLRLDRTQAVMALRIVERGDAGVAQLLGPRLRVDVVPSAILLDDELAQGGVAVAHFEQI